MPMDTVNDIRSMDTAGRSRSEIVRVLHVSRNTKYIMEHEWGKRRYLDMSKLEEIDELKGKAEGEKRTGPRTVKSICERI